MRGASVTLTQLQQCSLGPCPIWVSGQQASKLPTAMSHRTVPGPTRGKLVMLMKAS